MLSEATEIPLGRKDWGEDGGGETREGAKYFSLCSSGFPQRPFSWAALPPQDPSRALPHPSGVVGFYPSHRLFSSPYLHLCPGPSRKESRQPNAFWKALAHWVIEGKGFSQGPSQSEAGTGAPACVQLALGASTLGTHYKNN